MKRIDKFLTFAPVDRRLLLTAAFSLVLVRMGLWVLPFGVLRRLLERLMRRTRPCRRAASPSAMRIAWAVEVASRTVPGTGRCLTKALTAHMLLRRVGYPSRLCIGVARGAQEHLRAHAWVECEDRVLVGRAGVSEYIPLSSLEEWQGRRPGNLLG